MTTPPPDQSPDGEQPPGEPPLPPAYASTPTPYPYPPPPNPYPYPTPPYPYPYGASPPRPRPRISAGMAVLGTFVYFAINLVVAFMAIAISSSSAGNGVLIGAAALLAVIAFGAGGALLAIRNANWKGIGLGLMIGWALTSLFTAGFCTGINPTMYT